MTTPSDQIIDILKESNLKGKELKSALREVVRKAWPDLPPWSTLNVPVIEEVQKASVGSGVVLTFAEDGVRKVVLACAGDHYKKAGEADITAYMIPGGFINLSSTPGSTLVPAASAPEDAMVGAAREIEEELKNADGSPLLVMDPARLKPMDTKALGLPNGNTLIVIGLMVELTGDEVQLIKKHVARLATDAAYREAVALQTINGDSGRPEVGSVEIRTLEEVALGNCNLLHKDQQSLFQAVHGHFTAKTCCTTKAKTKPPRCS